MTDKILIIEDDAVIHSLYRDTLTKEGFDVAGVQTTQEALDVVDATSFSLVFVDLEMPHLAGMVLFAHLHQQHPKLPVIAVTNALDPSALVEAARLGAREFLIKPHDPEDLTKLVHQALENARAERQKEMNDRLMIATRMASGICHHFNNMLEGVIGRASLLSARSDLPLDLYRELRAILDDGRQMAGLMRRLSYFGQTEMNIRQNLQPLSIIREAIKNTAQNHRNRIRLTCKFDESVSLHGDSRRVSELFTELLANACEAGPMDQLVTVTARLEKGEKKDWLHVTIEDEGPGLSQWQMENMFQPFFTTRFPAGRGLGLAVASAISTQLEGSLKVENRRPCGAVATVTVPVSIGSKIRTKAMTEVHPPTSDQRVLVVDDMPGVLEMISRMAGMVFDQQVVSISSGADAIKAASDPHNKFSIVLLDLGLKDMTGTHAYGQIRIHLPEIPILFISGFTSDPEMAKILDKDPKSGFLEKPFDLNQLKTAMQSF